MKVLPRKPSLIRFLSICVLILAILHFVFDLGTLLAFNKYTFFSNNAVFTTPRPLFVLLAEPRCYASTPLVLTNALSSLPESFKVVLLHSDQNQHCALRWVNTTFALHNAFASGRLVLRKDDKLYIGNIVGSSIVDWTTAIYGNHSWWEDFRQYGDTVLMMQSDSVICSRNQSLASWQNVNILGRVTHTTEQRILLNEPSIHKPSSSYFSIQRMDSMMKCLKKWKGNVTDDELFNKCATEGNTSTFVYGGHSLCFDREEERACPFEVQKKPWVAAKKFPEAYQDLLQYCPDVAKIHRLQHMQRSDPFVLIVEPRCHAATPIAVGNALTMLPEKFKVVMLYSHHNLHCVKHWLTEYSSLRNATATGRLILRMNDGMDPNIERSKYEPNSWNTLLMVNRTLWEDLRQFGDTVLTMQTDTIICNNNHSAAPWHGVNLLGGVSFTNNNISASNQTNNHHLNGGFSIRQIDWMLSCLEYAKGRQLSEDSFFNECPYGKTAVQIVDAMRFASDNGHSFCFEWEGQRVCPYGVHKPWVNGVNFPSAYDELERYCPDIKSLRERQLVLPFALLVEPRCYAAVPFVLDNALSMLPVTFKVVFLYSGKNQRCVDRWMADSLKFREAVGDARLVLRRMEEMGYNNTSDTENDRTEMNWYNLPFVNKTFWSDLRQYGDAVLTMQTDTMICSKNDSLVPWNTDILTGVESISNTRETANPMDQRLARGIFSVRRVDWVYHCLDRNNGTVLDEEMVLNNCAEGVAANMAARDSMSFTHPRCFNWDGHQICPYGVRQPWVAEEENPKEYQALVNYCPGITELRRLQHLETLH